MNKHSYVGQWLFHHRTRNGKTKKDIRLALGMEYEGGIENIEAGKRAVSPDRVELLCKVLNAPLDSYIEASLKDHEANLRHDITGTPKKAEEIETTSTAIDDSFGGLL